MADQMTFTDEDRTQFRSLVASPKFLDAPAPDRVKQLNALPFAQKIPQGDRDKIFNVWVSKGDSAFRKYAKDHPAAPTTPPAAERSLSDKAWGVLTTPIARQIFGEGANLSKIEEGRQKRFAEEAAKSPQGPLTGTERFAGEVAQQSANFLEDFTSPVGIATLGLGPKLGLLEKAEGAIPRVVGKAAGYLQKAFGVEQAGKAVLGAVDLAKNPTPEKAADVLVQGGAAAAALTGGKKSKGAKEEPVAAKAEPKKGPVSLSVNGKTYKLEPEEHAAINSMSVDDLLQKTEEVRGQARDLQRAREYNKQAINGIEQGERQIQELEAKRDQAELKLEDPKKYDAQIKNVKARLDSVKKRVFENNSKIENLTKEKVLDRAQMYTDIARDKISPPDTKARLKGATPGRPGPYNQPGNIQSTLPPGKPQAQAQLPPGSGTPQLPGATPGAPPPDVTPATGQTQGALPPGEAPPAQPQLAAGATPPKQIGGPSEAGPVQDRSKPIAAPGEVTPQPAKSPVPDSMTLEHVNKRLEQMIRTPYGGDPAEFQALIQKRNQLVEAQNQKDLAPTPEKTPEPPKSEVNGRPVILQEDGQPAAYTDKEPPAEEPAKPPAKEPEVLNEKIINKGNEKMREELGAPPSGAEPRTDVPPATPQQKGQAALRGGAVTEMPVADIQVDPKRFQFKQKAIGKGGTGEELRDVEQFDPEKAGVISVWKDPKDGKTYVVNGHHRLELAKRSGYEGNLLVQYLKATDAAEARLKGALINIAEGRGEAMDAAKVFREGGMDASKLKKYGISDKGVIAKQGLSLAKLDPMIFERVATGEIPEGKAAIIGEMLDTPAKQDAAVALLEKAERRGKKISDSEFREAVRLEVGRSSTIKQTEQTLFGDVESEHNVALEMGQVSDYIKQQLRSEKSLFGKVGNEAASKRLGETGNVINADQNKARADTISQIQEIYERLSKSSGPVSEALDSAAKELANGQSATEVKSRAYDRILAAIGAEVQALNGGGGKGVREGVVGASGKRSSEAPGRAVKSEPPPVEKPAQASRQSLKDIADQARAKRVPPEPSEKDVPAARKDLQVQADRPENIHKPEPGDLLFKPGEKGTPQKLQEAGQVVGGHMRWGKDESGADRIVKIDRVERLPNGSIAWHITNLKDGGESYTQGPINPKYVALPKTATPPGGQE